MGELLSAWMVQTLSLVSAAALTTTAGGVAYLVLTVRRMSRQVFGDDRTDHPGLVELSRRNRRRSERNERALRRQRVLEPDD